MCGDASPKTENEATEILKERLFQRVCNTKTEVESRGVALLAMTKQGLEVNEKLHKFRLARVHALTMIDVVTS